MSWRLVLLMENSNISVFSIFRIWHDAVFCTSRLASPSEPVRLLIIMRGTSPTFSISMETTFFQSFLVQLLSSLHFVSLWLLLLSGGGLETISDASNRKSLPPYPGFCTILGSFSLLYKVSSLLFCRLLYSMVQILF